VAQQSVDGRLAAAESNERIKRRSAATGTEDLLAEALTDREFSTPFSSNML
jgi:hypothetical protein